LLLGDAKTFIDVVTEGQPPAPSYFVYDATRNQERRPILDEHTAPVRMSVDEVVSNQKDGVIVIDTRDAQFFAAGHLVKSLNVGLQGRYAEYTGAVVKPTDRVIVACDSGQELEAKVRLARIGYDNVIGWLSVDELSARPDVVSKASRLTARQFADRRGDVPDLQVIDVRNEGETKLGMMNTALNIPIAQLSRRVSELSAARPTVVYCAGGYRSSLAASVLRANGFTDVSDVLGGYEAILQNN